ncbi:MAG: NADP-reducing hydrogenase subunit HndC [Actinobacteria bacterium]|nr:NADP-reducing hydrogenase subunit HndC [Actinomycetota bacterium]
MSKLTIKDLKKIKRQYKTKYALKKGGYRARVTVHMGTCGIAAGAKAVMEGLVDEVAKNNLKDVIVVSSGCAGLCSREPIVTVEQMDCKPIKYWDLNEDKVRRIVIEHLVKGKVLSGYVLPSQEDMPFFNLQTLCVLRNIGLIDPENLEEYIARDGYMAAAKALTEMTAVETIKVVKDSGLRGRGGAGFSTGIKWDFCARVESDVKYILCNGDEGDPGAFMDRSVMEADPHSVIEGMIIGAKAIGAHKGYIYVRAEYPLAVKRIKKAIAQCYEAGLLGKNILNSGFDFDLDIYLGAGAFVCGEETALMRSIEGKRGMPKARPPFPAHKGLWDKPTVLNNVETFANIPPIILNGADWFKALGTEKSTGTKVFALTGAVNNIGLVEVPMGISLRKIIYDIGGGIRNNRKFKAVQIGGPSGGCIPESLIDIPVDYESITETGAIMGSGGMVVMDDSACMVNLVKFFLGFTADESCGKCTPCRVGSRVMLKILDRITRGEGVEGDIGMLIKLGSQVKDTSLCGLGKTCPNPVLTTIKYFSDEFEAHIREKRCPACVCEALISYYILSEKCRGCMICLKVCPVEAIRGDKKMVHIINQNRCIKCGTCFVMCPAKYSAIVKVSGEHLQTPEEPIPVGAQKGA